MLEYVLRKIEKKKKHTWASDRVGFGHEVDDVVGGDGALLLLGTDGELHQHHSLKKYIKSRSKLKKILSISHSNLFEFSNA